MTTKQQYLTFVSILIFYIEKIDEKKNIRVVLIEETGEDSYFHLKVWIFLCLYPRSFYQQDREMKHVLPTIYRFS
jgi:hypothetical protein